MDEEALEKVLDPDMEIPALQALLDPIPPSGCGHPGCAYAAMIHALAAVLMAAPGATETLLAGSEALDHIGRAVAQAMDPTPCRSTRNP
ncbi:hypothetical protein PAPYR_8898 [Paratrimastix pyriformis]|uniref:Uncharacterized protein n=1 Tax=Paratrimastix pyriformis TaxID=342808 RepID=A0ABQ8UCF5_9EUKA|nr:hypothetical protein PAPYR_8898 [Paratrimastix pyriformis]